MNRMAGGGADRCGDGTCMASGQTGRSGRGLKRAYEIGRIAFGGADNHEPMGGLKATFLEAGDPRSMSTPISAAARVTCWTTPIGGHSGNTAIGSWRRRAHRRQR